MTSLDQMTLEPGDLSLLPFVHESGVKLVRDGQNWKGRCPFHPDTEQSLYINTGQTHWHCYADCQSGGTVVEWVMKSRNVSRDQAVSYLCKDSSTVSGTLDAIAKRDAIRTLDSPFNTECSDQQLLQQVVNYYHETLKQSSVAQAYLKKRGIYHGEALEYFKLGFSNRTLGYLLPEKNRKSGALLRRRLQRLGILKPSGHELFHGSLVVPVMENGIVNQVYGRKVTRKLRPGTPLHCYLPGGRQGFFNTKALQICEELILCPSIIDALTFWCAGYKNVTCRLGEGNMGPEELEALEHAAAKRVLIAYAGNPAGDKAANETAKALQGIGIDPYRIEFSGGMDANAYALAHPPASDSLGDAIRKAVWMGKGRPPSVMTRHVDTESVAEDEISESEPASKSPEVISTHPLETNHAIDVQTDDATTETVLPATVSPPIPTARKAEVKGDEVVMCLEDRRYRIRGLKRNLSAEQLKVNLLVSKTNALHVDILDLYAARPRLNFIKQAALELGVSENVIKQDLGQVLLQLELLQEKQIQEAVSVTPVSPSMSNKERKAAMALLRSPNLLQRIQEDYARCGIVGEMTNVMTGFLAALSRKLPQPLAVMIQSTSAAGKSALMDAILAFMPDEDRVQYSAITGQSLFYMDDINVKHKILAISEEEGASHATYALKLLLSEGQLSIASTGKDPDSGRHVTREYQVEGPVMVFSTTTAMDIDEELLNRCLVLSVNEDRAQTRAIHDCQRFEQTLEGLQAAQTRDDILRVHHNTQRLLKPLKVVNPYARQLTFLDDKTRTRRDHKKYLTLINAIALLHQYQREIKQTFYQGKSLPYVEVTPEDIAMANQLAHAVLGQSLDELPPQTRKLLMLIDSYVSERCESLAVAREDVRFSRRDIRDYTGWGDTQLKVHLKRLETMEYVLIHRGGRGRRFIYELLYHREGQDGHPFLMGLVDVDALTIHSEEEKRSGLNDNLSGLGRPPVGRIPGVSRGVKPAAKLRKSNGLAENEDAVKLNGLIKGNTGLESYSSHRTSMLQGGNVQ